MIAYLINNDWNRILYIPAIHHMSHLFDDFLICNSDALHNLLTPNLKYYPYMNIPCRQTHKCWNFLLSTRLRPAHKTMWWLRYMQLKQFFHMCSPPQIIRPMKKHRFSQANRRLKTISKNCVAYLIFREPSWSKCQEFYFSSPVQKTAQLARHKNSTCWRLLNGFSHPIVGIPNDIRIIWSL